MSRDRNWKYCGNPNFHIHLQGKQDLVQLKHRIARENRGILSVGLIRGKRGFDRRIDRELRKIEILTTSPLEYTASYFILADFRQWNKLFVFLCPSNTNQRGQNFALDELYLLGQNYFFILSSCSECSIASTTLNNISYTTGIFLLTSRSLVNSRVDQTL